MRVFLLAFVLGFAGCKDNELVCRLDTECVGGQGEFGVCADSHCAFRDTNCPNGYRWDDSAGADADQCLTSPRIDAGVRGPDAR